MRLPRPRGARARNDGAYAVTKTRNKTMRVLCKGIFLCLGLIVACGPLLAEGVTRSVAPVAGGCKVTLQWEFSGHVESDLIIEEHLATGWTVDATTVPLGALDATWFSGPVARFAVKPALLAKAGAISFTVVPAEGAISGAISGSWKLYLNGALSNGTVGGDAALSSLGGTLADSSTSGTINPVEKTRPLAVTSFKVLGGGGCQLSYAGVSKAGTIIVQGCEGLGKPWQELTRALVPAGDGTITLEADQIRGCHFMRMKIVVTEE